VDSMERDLHLGPVGVCVLHLCMMILARARKFFRFCFRVTKHPEGLPSLRSRCIHAFLIPPYSLFYIYTPQYRWAVSVFFISYTLFDIPSNLFLRKLSPSVWLGSLAIACGALSLGYTLFTAFMHWHGVAKLYIRRTAFVQNLLSLMAVRFVLGLVQAGFVPVRFLLPRTST
jgi:hypothetical protein